MLGKSLSNCDSEWLFTATSAQWLRPTRVVALHSFHPGDIAVICELFTYVVQYTAPTPPRKLFKPAPCNMTSVPAGRHLLKPHRQRHESATVFHVFRAARAGLVARRCHICRFPLLFCGNFVFVCDVQVIPQCQISVVYRGAPATTRRERRYKCFLSLKTATLSRSGYAPFLGRILFPLRALR